jgi:hypothetical protein
MNVLSTAIQVRVEDASWFARFFARGCGERGPPGLGAATPRGRPERSLPMRLRRRATRYCLPSRSTRFTGVVYRRPVLRPSTVSRCTMRGASPSLRAVISVFPILRTSVYLYCRALAPSNRKAGAWPALAFRHGIGTRPSTRLQPLVACSGRNRTGTRPGRREAGPSRHRSGR